MKLATSLFVTLALTSPGVDAKKKKNRQGKKYMQTSDENWVDTDNDRLLTDCSLFFKNSMVDTSPKGDFQSGHITIPGNYNDFMPPKSNCGYTVDAPKGCKIQFKIKQLELETIYTAESCRFNDNVFLKWPAGMGKEYGPKYSGYLCGNHVPAPLDFKFSTQDPKYSQLVTDLRIGNNAPYYITGKDHLYVKFSRDDDNTGSSHTNAFELEWSCSATPEDAPVINRCEVTSSVFGNIGWLNKPKARFYAKDGPGAELKAENLTNLGLSGEWNTKDACGAQCAATAGCYFWNWQPAKEECSISVGMKAGFKGIKKQFRPSYLGHSMSGNCGGDIKFGTGYQKSTSFKCRFARPGDAARFESINICPYDGIMTTSRLATSNLEDDSYGWTWTKFRIATHIRLDPNAPQFSTFCSATDSVWDGAVSYYTKTRAANAKCTKPLRQIGTESFQNIYEKHEKANRLWRANTQNNCAANCAATAGCAGFHWDGSDCKLRMGSYAYEGYEDANVVLSGRMSSGCQARAPFEQSFTYTSQFDCTFATNLDADALIAEFVKRNGASSVNNGWDMCRSRSGIRTSRKVIASVTNPYGATVNEDGTVTGWTFIRFQIQTYIRMPRQTPDAYDQCEGGTSANYYDKVVPFTTNVKESNKCPSGFAFRYGTHPDDGNRWAKQRTNVWAHDLGLTNTLAACPENCAKTAGCWSYNMFRNGGCALNIATADFGESNRRVFRQRDTRVQQSGHIKRSCDGNELPFETSFTKVSSFVCSFRSRDSGIDLVKEIIKNNGLTKSTKFNEWQVNIDDNEGVSTTRFIQMRSNQDFESYLPDRKRRSHYYCNGCTWVYIQFNFMTHTRRYKGDFSAADILADLDDDDFLAGIGSELVLPDGVEVDETSPTTSVIEQADESGSGSTAGTNCRNENNSLVCDCNDGFRWVDSSCVADSPADEEEEDELATVLSDNSAVEEIETLEVPEGTEVTDTTEITSELTTDTDGESSGSCNVRNDGTLGTCTCNDGFTANAEGVCVSDTPETVNVEAALNAALDDSDIVSAIESTDFGAGDVLEQTEPETIIEAITVDGEAGGSCTAPGDCTCNDGFVDVDGECVNELTLPPPTTTCNTDDLEIDTMINTAFDNIVAQIEAIDSDFATQFDSTHRGPFGNIHDRAMINKESTSANWACSSTGNVGVVYQSADGVTDDTCSTLGVATVQDLCARLTTMYDAIFANCSNNLSRTQLERRCERVNNAIVNELGSGTGIDWL
jgi:hypothetical protein